MRHAAETVAEIADRAGVTLAIEPVHVTLWVDADRVTQVLTNLLSNAVKFSPRHSTVRLSAEVDAATFTFRVSDEGRGIPAEKLGTIFERFKQVDASDSRDKGGTGLGLAICRSLATAHGGRIWAESTPGEGSVFHFAVPVDVAASMPAAERAPDDSSAPANTKPLVLIVEDDADLARVISAALQAQGLRTIHAGGGRSAIEACRQRRPDLILLDVILPEMSGFEVVEWLRHKPALQALPLIVYSALELGATQQGRLRLGTTVFLTKSRAPIEIVGRHVTRLLQTMSANEKEIPGAA
jgi:CheY-like chemotaxis protein/anti-sigma regulatory factor (Ser/Thr protein kinase)